MALNTEDRLKNSMTKLEDSDLENVNGGSRKESLELAWALEMKTGESFINSAGDPRTKKIKSYLDNHLSVSMTAKEKGKNVYKEDGNVLDHNRVMEMIQNI